MTLIEKCDSDGGQDLYRWKVSDRINFEFLLVSILWGKFDEAIFNLNFLLAFYFEKWIVKRLTKRQFKILDFILNFESFPPWAKKNPF